MAKTKKYELTGGKHYGYNDEGVEVRYKKGDIIELTANEYNAFKDKFAEVPDERKVASGTPTKPTGATSPTSTTSATKPAGASAGALRGLGH